MSEKIYAFLLHLFPSPFRKRYKEEVLRLLRDRLNEERGFLRRLRLSFDLVFDMILALPQAYRNSYAEVVAVASAAPSLSGLPSFQSLQSEPIHRGAFVVASVLTLTVLFTLGYVMELPIPYPAAQPNGGGSPIESVLERLNKPTSYELTEDVRSETPQSVPTTLSTPKNRVISITNSALSHRTRHALNAAGQILAPSKENQRASTFDYGSSRAVTAPSSPMVVGRRIVQSQTAAVTVGAGDVSPTGTRAPVAVATNLSGQWTESSRADRSDVDMPHLFIFDQNNTVLSGTGGPDLTDQYSIIHGSVTGDYAKFELNHERKSFLYALRIEGEELKGTLAISSANESRIVTVSLERAH